MIFVLIVLVCLLILIFVIYANNSKKYSEDIKLELNEYGYPVTRVVRQRNIHGDNISVGGDLFIRDTKQKKSVNVVKNGNNNIQCAGNIDIDSFSLGGSNLIQIRDITIKTLNNVLTITKDNELIFTKQLKGNIGLSTKMCGSKLIIVNNREVVYENDFSKGKC